MKLVLPLSWTLFYYYYYLKIGIETDFVRDNCALKLLHTFIG